MVLREERALLILVTTLLRAPPTIEAEAEAPTAAAVEASSITGQVVEKYSQGLEL